MKIAIPVDNNNENTTVCFSFGRAPFFMIYDSELKTYEFFDNSAAASQGGAGIKASQFLVDRNIKVVLTPRCGQNAAQVLNMANVKIYRTSGESAKENVNAYLAGKLPILSDIHAGFHNHGNK